MTVLEVVKKYGLEDYKKSYKNLLGNDRNLLPLAQLADMEVKSISINFPTNEVTITVVTFE